MDVPVRRAGDQLTRLLVVEQGRDIGEGAADGLVGFVGGGEIVVAVVVVVVVHFRPLAAARLPRPHLLRSEARDAAPAEDVRDSDDPADLFLFLFLFVGRGRGRGRAPVAAAATGELLLLLLAA